MAQDLQQRQPDHMEIAQLVRDLGSWRRARQEAAERALRDKGPEAIGTLLNAYERDSSRRRIASAAIGSLILLVNLVNFIKIIARYYLQTVPDWADIACLLLVGVYPLLLWRRTIFRRRVDRFVDSFAAMGDPRAVGPLIEVATTSDKSESTRSAVAIRALMAVLPRLTPSDAGLINAQQQAALCQMLNAASAPCEGTLNSQRAIVILRALEQIGDIDALPYVERIAEFSSASPRIKKLRETARDILPTLRARIKAELPGRSLLRPADAPDSLLLRPAQGSTEAEPQQLLRPAEQE